MRYGADMTAAEIARALDLTPANVHQITRVPCGASGSSSRSDPELMGNA